MIGSNHTYEINDCGAMKTYEGFLGELSSGNEQRLRQWRPSLHLTLALEVHRNNRFHKFLTKRKCKTKGDELTALQTLHNI